MLDTSEWIKVFKQSLRTQNDIFTVFYVDGKYVITRVDARGGNRDRWEVDTNEGL